MRSLLNNSDPALFSTFLSVGINLGISKARWKKTVVTKTFITGLFNINYKIFNENYNEKLSLSLCQFRNRVKRNTYFC